MVVGNVSDEPYKEILMKADEFFGSVTRAQPQNLQCGRGCSLCCYGLFEIGSGDVPIVAVCRAGGRSAQATVLLQQAGFKDVANLTGGMLRWRAEGHPVEGGSA